MQAVLLAAVQPDNTPHGYNLTFAFPMLMFIIVAGTLYLRFRTPHRVPGHSVLTAARRPAGAPSEAVAVAEPAGEVTETAPPPDEGVQESAAEATEGGAAEDTEEAEGTAEETE